MRGLRVGLAVAFPAGESLRTALTRLAERCDVVELTDPSRVDAVLRSTTDSPAPPGPPTIAWLDRPEDGASPLARSAAVVLASPSVARELRPEHPDVLALGPQESHPGARPLAPFTRTRIRRARGLGDAPAVVRCVGGAWTWDDRPLDDAATTTAVALASVLVTDSADAAVAGCAWATPVVAAPAVARVLDLPPTTGAGGATDTEVVDALLRDPAALARLSRACHTVYEREHSPDRTVLTLEDRLGRTDLRAAASPYALVLDELGTPADATIRRRAGESVRELRSYR